MIHRPFLPFLTDTVRSNRHRPFLPRGKLYDLGIEDYVLRPENSDDDDDDDDNIWQI